MTIQTTPDRCKSALIRVQNLQPAVFTVLLFLIAMAAPGFCAEYTLGREPGWVKPVQVALNATVPTENLSNGVYYLLSDSQTRVQPKGKVESYYHAAIKVVNSSGVQDASQVSVTYDPEYEHVTFHNIRVHRAGSYTEQLAREKIKVLQRESQLEYQIYDGSKSLNIILDDIRVGDTVEYSYTLSGGNPVFAGHYFSRIDSRWSIPVHQVRERLLWPAARKLFIKNHSTELKPVVSKRSGYREYVWALDDVPPLLVDEGIPSWYDPYPWVQVSDVDSWQEVMHWALSLYRAPKRISPELEAMIASVRTSYADDAGRVAAVLRFIQDEVRYMGIEVGPKSHAPSDPSVVFARRFGDCKEKTMLGVTMLRRLGIRAEPALVDTRNGKVLEMYLPSPNAFNHVILKVHVGDKVYWLDPTISLQRGSLDQISQPDYGRALVLSEQTTDLEQMAVPDNAQTTKLIQDTFDLRKGVGQPATYTVQTFYTSRSADYIRRQTANNSKQEVQKNYLKFYADKYPSIRLDKEMAIEDDEVANRITITEAYLIPEIWEKQEGSNKLKATIIPQDLSSYLIGPDTTQRTMPFGISHPINVRQTTKVLLPESWDIETSQNQVDDPAFRFACDARYAGNEVTLDYHYQSRKDFVAAEEVEAFKLHIKQADNHAWYYFTAPDPSVVTPAQKTSALNWTAIWAAVITLQLSLALAVSLYFYDPEPAGGLVRPQAVSGIGGWLILVAVGLVVQPIMIVVKNIDLTWVFRLDRWVPLTTPGTEEYNVLWAPALLLETVGTIALAVISVLLLILFFQKRSSLPKVFIYFRLSALLYFVVDSLLAAGIPAVANQPGNSGHATLVREGFFCLIWISYFLKSERVKATFVRRRKVVQTITAKQPEPVTRAEQPELTNARICPRCASSAIERVAKTGPHQGKIFLVCSEYPKCKHVVLMES